MQKAYLITQNTDLDKDVWEYERIYIWDQYCEHNMFYFFDDENFIEKILKLNKKITITTPIISEKWIKKFFNFLYCFLKKIWENKNFLEIVVNEQWIFNKLVNYYPEIKIVWWNFLSGQNKDPYLKIFKDKNEHKYLSIDSKYYDNLFKEKNIDNIELYNVFQWVDIKEQFKVHLYFPYVVYSINRYCITALIDQKINDMIIIEKCVWCINIEKDDLDMELKIADEKVKQYFRWNKQFYENNILLKYKNLDRIIYNYDLIK